MSARPIRVLHVLGALNRGGAETWILNVLRHIDRDRFRLDFAVHTSQPAAYDDEARALGARIFPCLRPHRPLRYLRNLRRILESEGPYDVVHSHVHHYSGIVLWQARRCGVRTRLAHSHSDTSGPDRAAGMARRGYLKLTERLVRRHATGGLAASDQAASALFGRAWRQDPRWRLLFCGIDLAPFERPWDRAPIAREFGIAPDAVIFGHVGRFEPQKNHLFLVDLFARIAESLPSAHLCLVGDGSLRGAVEERVRQLGLERRVAFAGVREDVPKLLLGLFDAFLLPSLFEGLPVALLEAQAAGVPCVVSDAISPQAAALPGLVSRLPLGASADAWAAVAIARATGTPRDRSSLEILRHGEFDILVSVRSLEAIYANRA